MGSYKILGGALLMFCIVSVSGHAPTSQQCAVMSSQSSPMKVVLRSHHNETGHWQSKVIFAETATGSQSNHEDKSWLVDVQQTSFLCDEGKATLETTITLIAPPVSPVSPGSGYGRQHVRLPPSGYQHYPGVGYFKFHHDVSPWGVARDKCVAEGGDLLVIDSAAKVDVLKRLFDLNPHSPGSAWNHEIYVGIHQVGNQWVTVKGNSLASTGGYTRWNQGEPNYSDTCVSTIRPHGYYNNINCATLLAFICEVQL